MPTNESQSTYHSVRELRGLKLSATMPVVERLLRLLDLAFVCQSITPLTEITEELKGRVEKLEESVFQTLREEDTKVLTPPLDDSLREWASALTTYADSLQLSSSKME